MHNQVCRFFFAIGFCLTASLAQAAGLRSIDIPADTNGPANQCHAKFNTDVFAFFRTRLVRPVRPHINVN